MWSLLKRQIASLLEEQIRRCYGVEHEPVAEVPPRRELGDLAYPAPLHLARTLKRNPRAIAAELIEGLQLPASVRELRIAGAGYLNFFLHRSAFASRLMVEPSSPPAQQRSEKVIVEHTNINPNKAAHIGHLRNAVLGDVLVRLLRRLGRTVETQNYIDDTGVQLADVTVGFVELKRLSLGQVAALGEPFDYVCWDLYAEVGRWYGADERRLELRRRTLRALEEGEGPLAEMGRLVARRVLRRHLATMRRLNIGYDLLTRESDILSLDFFADAFERLRAHGAVHLEEGGKNAGCWVMPLSDSQEFAGLEDPDKVIVRSDGTVTYVGKDIAYQLWKFGLLRRDFSYRFWKEEGVWETAREGADEHPPFGRADRVINVIDARQSYLQRIVRAGLEALGHEEEAQRSIHFDYEMVTLSPTTAAQLGYLGGSDDGSGPGSLEMSGRKGIGVKADDLMDRLEEKSRQEIARRNRDLSEAELNRLAVEIATGALRFFMVRAGTSRVIAFDFDEALSFEGDSGPYLQYALVRVRNICRRLEEAGLPTRLAAEELAGIPAEKWTDDLWDLVLYAAQVEETAERAARSLELSLLTRHALDLAQRFNAIYHRHPILQETDPDLRTVRLATALLFFQGLSRLADLLGIPIPERM